MLTVILTGDEVFNDETNEFSSVGDIRIQLEHSLLSLSKWESKFEKPFLGIEHKPADEILWYVEAMIISPYPDNLFQILSQNNLRDINTYIESKQSATSFGQMPTHKTRGRSETITSELIYYWMVAFNIPFECEHWHLNRLFALIRICNIKNSKPTKMSRNDVAQRNRDLNAQRRAAHNTSG